MVVRGIGMVSFVSVFFFLSLSFIVWVKAVPIQPLSLVRREVIQTDVKELLEVLKAFVWFSATRCVFRFVGICSNRLMGVTLMLAFSLSWFGYATFGTGIDIQADGLFHTIRTLRRS